MLLELSLFLTNHVHDLNFKSDFDFKFMYALAFNLQ